MIHEMNRYWKISIISVAILILVLIISLSAKNILGNSSSTPSTQSVQNQPLAITGDVQIINLKVQGSTYIIEPSVLKKGMPVRMVADLNTLVGCSRAVVIKDFGVNKYLRTGDNTIEFTPDKTGTFVIACTMNMYRGTFTVTDDGSAPTGIQVQQAAQIQSEIASAPKGTCGMSASGGGCGCGGGI